MVSGRRLRIETKAGSYGVKKYHDIISICETQLSKLFAPNDEGNIKLVISNYYGVASQQTLPFELKKVPGNFVITKERERVLFVVTEEKEETIKGLMVLAVPGLGSTTANIEEKEPESNESKNSVLYRDDWIEDEHFKISWKKRSWSIGITQKKTNETIEFTGFTGPIDKQNPALSALMKFLPFHLMEPLIVLTRFRYKGLK